MKNKKPLYLIFSIIIFALVVITMIETNGKYGLAQSAWESNTRKLIQNSEGKDGGFSILISQRTPSLNETLFDIKLLKNYGFDIPNQETLKESLREMQKEKIKLDGLQDIINIDDYIQLCKILNIDFNTEFTKSIQNTILKSQGDDGLFHIDKNDNLINVITSTEKATSILSNLNIKIDNLTLLSTLENLYEGQSYKNITINNAAPKYKWTIYNSIYNIEKNISSKSYYNTENGIKLEEELQKEAIQVFSQKPKNEFELFNDIALFELLQKSNHTTPIISSQFIDFLNEIKMPDGGFSLHGFESNAELTFEILRLYPGTPNIQNLIQNMKGYQLNNGMFASRNDIKSNIIASYMVQVCYHDLGLKGPVQLGNYLIQYDLKKITPKELFYLNNSYKILGKPEVIDTSYVVTPNLRTIDDLYSLANAVNINSIQGNTKDNLINYLKGFKHTDGGYGLNKDSNFEETNLFSIILNKLGSPDLTTSLQSWVFKNQKVDGGFSNKLDSNLIDTYFALNILTETKTKPKQLTETEKFITNNKEDTGGYAFLSNEKSAASIEATYYGLEAERLIQFLK